jgi:hypothetical protein
VQFTISESTPLKLVRRADRSSTQVRMVLGGSAQYQACARPLATITKDFAMVL